MDGLFTLSHNNVVHDNLACPIADVVHPTDPLYHVLCLELLSDTLMLRQLIYQPQKHILSLLVNVGKVYVKLASGQQVVIEHVMAFFQIFPAPLPPNPDGLIVVLWKL